jgi:hypothetical protein
MASTIASWAVFAAALICVHLFINWLKLSKAPGPLVAGTTDLWRAYMQYNGKLRQKLIDLHSKCGPIVRYGVRSISINDPEIINVVYGSRAGFITVTISEYCFVCSFISILTQLTGRFVQGVGWNTER